MKLLYSGAKFPNSEQKESNLSLGGFISSTSIPNSRLNILFSDISQYNLQNKVNNCVGIFIKNDTTQNVNNLSIEQVYESLNGEYTNWADFDFSVTEVSDRDSIELIGSIFEEPFHVDWFECESRFESCLIKINNPGGISDNFSIFGITGIFKGNSIESMIDDLILALNNDGNFSCSKLSENEIFVEKNIFEITNDNSNFLTDGSGSIENVNLSNGKIGKTIISDSLEPGKSLGLWIRRKINNNYKKQESECLTVEEQKLKFSNKENLQIIFEFD